jgi:rubrerythrin
MAVRTWRCNICGDGYIGEGKPTHCPFCGAPAKYIVEAEKYKEPVVSNLTEKSKKNIEEAIKLEIGNAQFYFGAAKAAKDIEMQARFKALGKVESEHATLLSKIIKAPSQTIDRNAVSCKLGDAALNKESHDRETNAIQHYRQFLAEADSKELRVRQVFAAIVEVETTHLQLADDKSF